MNIDYQAFADELVASGFRDGEASTTLMNALRRGLIAAVGDTVLYEIVEGAGKEWQDFKPMLDIMKRDGCLVQVWPEVKG